MSAPSTPALSARSLVLWLGDGGRVALEEVDRRAVGCVAMRLAHASRNATALASARTKELGRMFDGEAWRTQLDPGHPLRGPTFRALGSGLPP